MTTIPRKRPTLRCIADEAGLSVSTVSRVLNGKSEACRISGAAQADVLAAAKRLDFSPNLLARNLRMKVTQTIGLVLPDISNLFFSRVAQCVAENAKSRGYSVLLCDSTDQTQAEIDELEVLESRRVDGLVICPVGISFDHLERFQHVATPVVIVDRFFPELTLPTVGCDNLKGAQQAVEHLLHNGHRRIAFLQGLPNSLPNLQRIKGYRQALSRQGVPVDESLIMGTGFSVESGFEGTRQLIVERPDVTAIFASSNQCAFGALRAIGEANKNVPQDISIVTFDDIENVEFMSTPLTAVAQPVEAMGHRAAELLFEQISTKTRVVGPPTLLPTELIVRASVRNVT